MGKLNYVKIVNRGVNSSGEIPLFSVYMQDAPGIFYFSLFYNFNRHVPAAVKPNERYIMYDDKPFDRRVQIVFFIKIL